MITEKHTCEKLVFPDSFCLHGHSCGRTATLMHEGQWYCKTHHPPTIAARWKVKQDAWDAERERKNADRIAKHVQSQRESEDHARMESLAEGDWQSNLSTIVEKFPFRDDLRESIDEWVKDRNMRP